MQLLQPFIVTESSAPTSTHRMNEETVTKEGSASTSTHRRNDESTSRATDQWNNVMNGKKIVPFICGVIMTFNFLALWAIPIAGMGLTWKWMFQPIFGPIYNFLDTHPLIRAFAEKYVYANPKHSDFFMTSILTLINFVIGLSVLLYYQFKTGSLPYWIIAVYYCSWVGTGGRIMGAAYALAHKEVRITTIS